VIGLLLAALSVAAPADFAGCRGEPVDVALERFEDLLVVGSPDAEVAFADCLARVGLLHSAQRHYLEVVKAGPGTPGFPEALGRAFVVAEEIGDLHSVSRYIRGLSLRDFPARPGRDALLFVHGRNLLLQGQPGRAAGVLDEISGDFGWPTETALALGRSLELVGEYRQALDVYRQVEGADRDVLRQRESLLLARMSEPARALAVMEQIGPDSPRRSDALAIVANLWLGMADDENARTAAREASRLARRAQHLSPAELVLAEIDVDACRVGRATLRLRRFERDWRPTAMALDAAGTVGRPSGWHVWEVWEGPDPVAYGISPALMDRMRQDAPERAFLEAHLDQLERELVTLDGIEHEGFQAVVAPHVERVVHDGHAQIRYLLGESFLAQIRATSKELERELRAAERLTGRLAGCE